MGAQPLRPPSEPASSSSGPALLSTRVRVLQGPSRLHRQRRFLCHRYNMDLIGLETILKANLEVDEATADPPSHHARGHLERKVHRPWRGHSRGNLPQPCMPCTEVAPPMNVRPTRIQISREASRHRHPHTQGYRDGEGCHGCLWEGMGKGAAMLDDATMVAGSRAIVDRVEQGSVAVGYGVTRRRRDPADPAGTSSQPPNLISLRKSLFFF